MIRTSVVILGCLVILASFPVIVIAQVADPAALQRIATVLQQQRNAAMDAHVLAEARVIELQAEIARLKAELEETRTQRDAIKNAPIGSK